MPRLHTILQDETVRLILHGRIIWWHIIVVHFALNWSRSEANTNNVLALYPIKNGKIPFIFWNSSLQDQHFMSSFLIIYEEGSFSVIFHAYFGSRYFFIYKETLTRCLPSVTRVHVSFIFCIALNLVKHSILWPSIWRNIATKTLSL